MRIALTLAATAVLALTALGGARAQAPTPELKTFTGGADVPAMIATARQKYDPKGFASYSMPLLTAAPYEATLEYRTRGGTSSVHEKQAEMIYIMEGKGVFVTGGTLTDPKRLNAANLQGSGIAGGTARPIAKGDWIMVPENTPHWFKSTEGELLLMALHVPRG
jgi:mannose-6-phosphate isomerase-like protein (cupin superfamily)